MWSFIPSVQQELRFYLHRMTGNMEEDWKEKIWMSSRGRIVETYQRASSVYVFSFSRPLLRFPFLLPLKACYHHFVGNLRPCWQMLQQFAVAEFALESSYIRGEFTFMYIYSFGLLHAIHVPITLCFTSWF